MIDYLCSMEFFEIFTLVTGVIYLVLEIRQHNWMWIVGVLTAAAGAYVFGRQGLYASMALNIYYFFVSFYGLWAWSKDAAKIREEDVAADRSTVHLNELSWRSVAWSLLVLIAGTIALIWVLDILNDPMSNMDAGVTVLSAIATFWLSRSYPQQWLLWIVADTLSAYMCARQELYWMCGLYIVYAVSAVYGYIHWKRNGIYVEE